MDSKNRNRLYREGIHFRTGRSEIADTHFSVLLTELRKKECSEDEEPEEANVRGSVTMHVSRRVDVQVYNVQGLQRPSVTFVFSYGQTSKSVNQDVR